MVGGRISENVKYPQSPNSCHVHKIAILENPKKSERTQKDKQIPDQRDSSNIVMSLPSDPNGAATSPLAWNPFLRCTHPAPHTRLSPSMLLSFPGSRSPLSAKFNRS